MALVILCDAPTPSRDALERALVASGHRVQTAPDTGALGSLLRIANDQRTQPDCVYLEEAAAGGTSGLFSTAQRLRGSGGPSIATLGVIARPEPEARAAALQILDDVVSRPAHLVEVTARIEALLRRPPVAPAATSVGEDAASGLKTRALLDERITEEWRRAARYTEPLALLIVGLSGDSAQPPLLDRALREVGAALRRSLRQIDVLGRFGAIEVAALLVNTHLAGALTCADRLRRELASLQPRIDATMGLALFPGKDVTSGPDLVRVAERALALARSQGMGSVCVIQHQGFLFEGRAG